MWFGLGVEFIIIRQNEVSLNKFFLFFFIFNNKEPTKSKINIFHINNKIKII